MNAWMYRNAVCAAHVFVYGESVRGFDAFLRCLCLSLGMVGTGGMGMTLDVVVYDCLSGSQRSMTR